MIAWRTRLLPAPRTSTPTATRAFSLRTTTAQPCFMTADEALVGGHLLKQTLTFRVGAGCAASSTPCRIGSTQVGVQTATTVASCESRSRPSETPDNGTGGTATAGGPPAAPRSDIRSADIGNRPPIGTRPLLRARLLVQKPSLRLDDLTRKLRPTHAFRPSGANRISLRLLIQVKTRPLREASTCWLFVAV